MPTIDRRPTVGSAGRRRLAVRAVLVLAVLALLATSPTPNDLTEELELDALLGAGTEFELTLELNPAAVAGQEWAEPPAIDPSVGSYHPPESDPAAMVRGLPELRVRVDALGEDGRFVPATRTAWGWSHPDGCPGPSGCTQRFRVSVAPQGVRGDPGARLRTEVRARVEFRSDVPDEAAIALVAGSEATALAVGEARRRQVPQDPTFPGVIGRSDPPTLVTFTRTADATGDPVVLRAPPRRTTAWADLRPLGPWDDTPVQLELPARFDPFTGCPSGERCVRDYVLSSSGEVAVRTPEGVHVDRGAARMPLAAETRTAATSTGGTVELGPGESGAVRDHQLRIGPEDAPTTAGGRVAALLTVTATGAPDTAVEVELGPDATRRVPADGTRVTVGAWLRGELVDEGGPRRPYLADVPLRFRRDGDASVEIQWALRVALDADAAFLPEGARLRLERVGM